MIRKISGNYKNHTVHFLEKKNGETATDHPSIADTLADEFSYNSSTEHYSLEFQQYKEKVEKKSLNFSSKTQENYNMPFTISELDKSLKSSHDTAVGPDDVHYQILKHLPQSALLILLNIFNKIWFQGTFPTSWHKAITVPIAKPGKDPTQPTSYRPIALTSCVCKTMERMVNARLVSFLELNGFIAPQQSGFRSQRSTIWYLLRHTFEMDLSSDPMLFRSSLT